MLFRGCPSSLGGRSDPSVSFNSSVSSLRPVRERFISVPPRNASPHKRPTKIILRGRGLKEAEVDVLAAFYVDGAQAYKGVFNRVFMHVRVFVNCTSLTQLCSK